MELNSVVNVRKSFHEFVSSKNVDASGTDLTENFDAAGTELNSRQSWNRPEGLNEGCTV